VAGPELWFSLGDTGCTSDIVLRWCNLERRRERPNRSSCLLEEVLPYVVKPANQQLVAIVPAYSAKVRQQTVP
jgi:hypothetical protein